MSMPHTRREMLQRSLAMAGLGVLGLPDWALPALAPDEVVIPFVDFPQNLPTVSGPDQRIVDVRKVETWLTSRDQFFTTQHYGHPVIDPATFRLKVTGLIDHPQSFSVDDLKRMKATDLVSGFECSGNRGPIEGLCSNGKWTGVPLHAVLEQAGLKPHAHEIVFFGADRGQEELDFRGQKYTVEQQFGRSLQRDKATSPELLVAYSLNVEPLTLHQGAPLRLIVPGWYGVANVKWLSQIHAQEDPYVGKYQVRWYRTLRGETIDGETKWVEAAVTHMNLKSFIARVSRVGDQYKVFGIGLNDGTPFKSIEVRVDDGPWRPATMDPNNSQYSWKWFTCTWTGVTPGEHTLVSRAIDADGNIQPTTEDLGNKKTFLEDNAQCPRKVMIA